MDLLLRAIPYVTFAQVVGFSPKAAADSSLSKDDLPFEDQYNAAIIEVLQRLGYAADSSHNKEVGKVDIFVNIDNRTFGVECIMAKRGPTDHENHRGRFDTALYAYSNADHKALVTIGSSKSRARERVLKTKADGVEIIGLVPNIAHTGYNILYRGAQAAEGADLVEYYVECDLVARALDTSNRIRCIQKVLHINKPAQPIGAKICCASQDANCASFTVGFPPGIIIIESFQRSGILSELHPARQRRPWVRVLGNGR
ncbi:unnamed protein product [Effrenium voratum]|nr:unnamed protein product [Effrenium voratum]